MAKRTKIVIGIISLLLVGVFVVFASNTELFQGSLNMRRMQKPDLKPTSVLRLAPKFEMETAFYKFARTPNRNPYLNGKCIEHGPTIKSPGKNGSTLFVNVESINFVWEGVENADSYEVFVKNPEGDLKEINVSATSSSTQTKLLGKNVLGDIPGGFVWTVTAVDKDCDSKWGAGNWEGFTINNFKGEGPAYIDETSYPDPVCYGDGEGCLTGGECVESVSQSDLEQYKKELNGKIHNFRLSNGLNGLSNTAKLNSAAKHLADNSLYFSFEALKNVIDIYDLSQPVEKIVKVNGGCDWQGILQSVSTFDTFKYPDWSNIGLDVKLKENGDLAAIVLLN